MVYGKRLHICKCGHFLGKHDTLSQGEAPCRVAFNVEGVGASCDCKAYEEKW